MLPLTHIDKSFLKYVDEKHDSSIYGVSVMYVTNNDSVYNLLRMREGKYNTKGSHLAHR